MYFNVAFTTVNCTIPEEPSNVTIVDYNRLNETVLEGTVLTYQCDNGFSLTGPNTITCTNAGVWSTELEAIVCVSSTEGESTEPEAHGGYANPWFVCLCIFFKGHRILVL